VLALLALSKPLKLIIQMRERNIMSTEKDDKIFTLTTKDIRLPENQQNKTYKFINSSQLYFMLDDYIDIICEEVSDSLFDEKLNLRNNIEKVYETINDINVNQVFDAELVGPDNHTIIGQITISRSK
jgi:hypothetical protein